MERLLAIGDIHGERAKLEGLLGKLKLDPARDELLFIGDYIDRGPDARGVIDLLLKIKKSRFKATFLQGNHEYMLTDCFLNKSNPNIFLYNGGLITLDSYRRPGQEPLEARPPAQHLDFFSNLELYHRWGDYVFVHAGLRPGIPLEEQSPDDLLWIREEFFLADNDWPFKVVFGHTPFRDPFREKNLYGIDTGATYGGKLTCLILPDETFVQI